MIKICKLYIKKAKGVAAERVCSATLIEALGVEGDIFAKGGERQVSILLAETEREIAAAASKEACLSKFACNAVLSGCSLSDIAPGMKLRIGGAELEISRVGRECHAVCPLGSCPLIEGAVFAKVTRGGEIHEGDIAEI